MKLQVIDKNTDRVVWEEKHDTVDSLESAIEHLKQNNFNPKYFEFVKC